MSFRYAQNLVAGQGLVYNPGERVEGYTNLSWTLLLAGVARLGADPVAASASLGLLFHLALAGLLAARAWKRRQEADAPFLPLAAAVVLVLPDAQVWATGGLETSLFGFLAVAAVLASLDARGTTRLIACGVLSSLLVLTRPDGALFAGVALLSIAAPRPGKPRGLTRETLFLLAAGLLFAAYVMRTGGDFMHARRLLPALPFLLLVLEEIVRTVFRPPAALGVAAVCTVAAALPYPVFSDAQARISGVADERRFYPAEAIAARTLQGEVVGAALRGTGARVMFGGGMLCFGYYSRLPYLVEMTGLTQYSLARLPIRQRGFIGHEKTADAAWMTANRVHVFVLQNFPPIPPRDGPLPLDEIDFGQVARARVWIYSDVVMDRLRGRPDVGFVPIEAALERIRAGRDGRSPADAARLASWLERVSLRPASPLRRDVEDVRELLLRRAKAVTP